MAIILPTFEDTFCRMVGVCFSKVPEGVPALVLPLDAIEMVSTYDAHNGPALARLIWNPEARHFHVDVALRAAFGNNPPAAKTSIEDFLGKLELFKDLAAPAFPHGRFSVPLVSLPAAGGLIFVGNSAIRVDIGNAEVELTGATLTFRRSYIRKIRWTIIKDDVRLDVDAKRRMTTVNDGYLLEALRSLNDAVATYVLGRNADGQSRL